MTANFGKEKLSEQKEQSEEQKCPITFYEKYLDSIENHPDQHRLQFNQLNLKNFTLQDVNKQSIIYMLEIRGPIAEKLF